MTFPDLSTNDGSAPDVSALRIALIGYGEVGGIFGAALASAGVAEVAAYDVKIDDRAWAASARDRATRDGVHLAADASGAMAGASLVISAVTAAATETAVRAIADACAPGTLVLDVNSASPQTKTRCAKVVERAGGHYIEAAVMTSVPPYGIRVPMLLGGPHAHDALPLLQRLGFAARAGSPTYGVVSAVKLCRSVVIKGMEALAIESMLAARHYGVESEVLASLNETFPGLNWEKQVSYFWRRVVAHGQRRSEEMREAAVTVGDAGFAGHMASATADVQAWIADLRAQSVFEGVPADAGWSQLADRVGDSLAKSVTQAVPVRATRSR